MKLKVIFFQRKPHIDFFSIEHVFDIIRFELKHKITYKTLISKHKSKEFWKRVYILFAAFFNQEQNSINHITGDVNFLSIFLSSNRTILTLHDFHFLEKKKGISYFLLFFFWLYLPLRKVKYITVVSNYTKDRLIAYTNLKILEKVKVIYNPINPLFIPSTNRQFNKEKPTLLQIGTKKHKGLNRLILAIQDISCHLIIIGTIEEETRQFLEKYKIEYSNFVDISVEELYLKYAESDILTFVSEKEGFGLPIIEANAVGRPVITGNITSMPEIAGDAALLVNPFDVNEIRNGILELINNEQLRDELVAKGYENIKRFDTNIIAKKYFNLYQMLANENNKN